MYVTLDITAPFDIGQEIQKERPIAPNVGVSFSSILLTPAMMVLSCPKSKLPITQW